MVKHRYARVNIKPALELAGRQYDVITRQQALDTGLTSSALRRMDGHGWERPLRGVYLTAPGGHEQALTAALFWAGRAAVVSHRAAACLHDLEGVDEDVVEITIPQGQSLRKTRVIVHRSDIPESDSQTLRRLPVTTLTRTILDLGSCVDTLTLAMAVEHAWRRERAVLARLREAFDEWRGHGRPGTANIQRVLEDCKARGKAMESALEVRMWWLLKDAGLPLPKTQHQLRDPVGSMRVDFAYPDRWLAIEADSHEFHGEKGFEDHCARSSRLAALGWRVIHVTKRHMLQRMAVLDVIRRALESSALLR